MNLCDLFGSLDFEVGRTDQFCVLDRFWKLLDLSVLHFSKVSFTHHLVFRKFSAVSFSTIDSVWRT